MIAADVEIAASAIICMGYPLKVRCCHTFSTILCGCPYSLGTNGKIGDETLLQLDIRVMLFRYLLWPCFYGD